MEGRLLPLFPSLLFPRRGNNSCDFLDLRRRVSRLLVGNAKSQVHIQLLLAPCAQAAAGTPRQSLPPWSRPGIPVPALLTCSKSAEAPTAFGQRARLGRGGNESYAWDSSLREPALGHWDPAPLFYFSHLSPSWCRASSGITGKGGTGRPGSGWGITVSDKY